MSTDTSVVDPNAQSDASVKTFTRGYFQKKYSCLEAARVLQTTGFIAPVEKKKREREKFTISKDLPTQEDYAKLLEANPKPEKKRRSRKPVDAPAQATNS